MDTEGSYGPTWAPGCQKKGMCESATWKVRLSVCRWNCILSTKSLKEKRKRKRSSDRAHDREAQR